MKHILMIPCLCCMILLSCKKDVSIGPPTAVPLDYALPQGDAPKEANDKIQALYDKYGSFFLYKFTQKDFIWVPSTGGANSKIDTAVLGNPVYTMDMLNFLDDIWLKFLPEDFKKNKGIPYRVMMADTIKQYRPGYPPGREYLYFDYKVVDKSITFAGMNASLRTMTAAEKIAKKNILIGVIWNYYIQNGILNIPSAFYEVSDYVTYPVSPINAANPANVEAFRQRGFLPASYNAVTGAPSEWYYGTFSWSGAKPSDIASYILAVTTRTDAQMQPFLAYPLIKQKFDLLVNHFKSRYNIDVRAIANATY
ncbi:hypothetical protein HF324_12600 [Chitinophaga oryzae]|uniref:Uncharacterized protein n=1 Tax=Chitinophaga oryzae TaxID=2725414 RepID=A0AAE6ZHB0_9BACT|nr:hypothetical protein [Chitinophaga oryzae]QJB32182.1 hypothetical protein HF329_12935 [Chitinophaga oryzae]QJB38659.1 hypothetical protein HF324_12600 [Chitinophaga oryzae]